MRNNYTQQQSLVNASLAALGGLVLLLLLSVFFYRERMLFIDAPHILFRIVNDGQLQITEHRYGSFITQMVPLIATKLHMPLLVIMILYSASFYLFYITCAVLLIFVYRQYALAILLGLYATLFVSDTFYWPNNEIHQGIAWLFIAFAIFFRQQQLKRNLVVAILCFAAFFFLAIWTHPLVMLVAVYLWFFFALEQGIAEDDKKAWVSYTIILLALALAKFYYGMNHGYDSGKIETVTGFKAKQITRILSSPQFKYFVKGCIYNYWLFSVLVIAGIVAMLMQKKYVQLLLTAMFGIGYVALICITYWDATAGRFYIESEYMPLTIICAAPFVFFVLPKVNARHAIIVISVIVAIRVGYIINSSTKFTNRIMATEQILAKMKTQHQHKLIVINDGGKADSTFIMNWGAPVESMLLSALNRDVPQRTFIFLDSNQMKSFNTASRDTLLGAFEKRSAGQLNKLYFEIDTVGVYMKSEQ